MSTHKIEEIPNKIFKYYSFDPLYNKSRLTGSIYLASPWDFNDPNDCQLNVVNNVDEINCNDDWLKSKLIEIGIKEDLDDKIQKLRDKDSEVEIEVRTKQLEKLGILCLTQSHDNIVIWGYYTNNKGFCIEYDRDKIIKRLIIGFINTLSWELTEHLFNKKTYSEDPATRNQGIDKERLANSENIFKDDDVELLRNDFLRHEIEKNNVLNFIRNIHLKRFGGGLINYDPDLDRHEPTLFYDKNSDAIKSKYYTKSSEWKNEDEYRLAVSLGGRTVVDLGKECIKSIRLGCNISITQVFEIISILSENDMKDVELFMMKKESNGLIEKSLSKNIFDLYQQFKTQSGILK